MKADKSNKKPHEPTIMKYIRKLGNSYTVSIHLNNHSTRLCSCQNIQYAIVIRDLALKYLKAKDSSYNAYEITKNLPVPQELAIKIELLRRGDIAHNSITLNEINVEGVILRINDPCSEIPKEWNVTLFEKSTALSRPATDRSAKLVSSNKKRAFTSVNASNTVTKLTSEKETTTTSITPVINQNALASSYSEASLQGSHNFASLTDKGLKYILREKGKYSVFLYYARANKRVCYTSNIKYAIVLKDLCDKYLELTTEPIARSITQYMNVPEELKIKINLLLNGDHSHKGVNIDKLVFDNMTLLRNDVDNEIPKSWNVKFQHIKAKRQLSPCEITSKELSSLGTYVQESQKRRKIIDEADDELSVTAVDPAAQVVDIAADIPKDFIPRSSSNSVFLQRYGNLAIEAHTNAAVYSSSNAALQSNPPVSITPATSLLFSPQSETSNELSDAYKRLEQRKAELAVRLKALEEEKIARAKALNDFEQQREKIKSPSRTSHKI